jgi:hypothetical protein
MRRDRHRRQTLHSGLRTALLVTAVVTMALPACSRMVTGTASSEPPHVFPNLDQFAAVNNDDYVKQEHTGNTLYFKAPNGIECSLSGYLSMQCSGVPFALPDAGSDDASAGCTGVEPTFTPSRESGNTYRFFHRPDACSTSEPDAFKPLPANSKVSLNIDNAPQFTCAVGSDLVACIAPDENHGFVLQPSASWTF